MARREKWKQPSMSLEKFSHKKSKHFGQVQYLIPNYDPSSCEMLMQHVQLSTKMFLHPTFVNYSKFMNKWGFKRNLFYCRMKKNLLFLFLNPLYLVMLKNTDLNNVLLILQYKRHVSTRVIELKKCEICVVFIFFICSYLFIYFLINSLLSKNCKSLVNIFRYT